MGFSVNMADKQAYDEVRDMTRRIECQLSEFLSEADFDSLRVWCFKYAEKKARWLELPRRDLKRAYLHAFVRYELMDEVQTFVEGFSDGNFKTCSDIALKFLEENGVEKVLERCERGIFSCV